jgi:hypothetical protein
MIKISHIVNLAEFPLKSDLYTAQQVTIETMRIARGFSASTVDVTLLSAQYSEDRKVVPEYFIATRDLDQSVLDVGNFKVKRKLPLAKDILDRACETVESDYIIFTNVDIALLPNFYTSVSNLIGSGFDSFVINRRTIPKLYTRVDDIPLMLAEVGLPHMGYDCFVFKREAYKNFILGLICVGAAHIGKAVWVNQILNSNKFKVFRDLHVTFHIGNDKIWKSKALKDYEEHNQREFRNIVSGLNPKQRALIRKWLLNHRWWGLKNKIARFLKLSS